MLKNHIKVNFEGKNILFNDIPFTVYDVNNYLLGVYKIGEDVSSEASYVLPESLEVTKVYALTNSVFSADFDEDTVVGQILVTDEDLVTISTDLILGRNIGEWAYDRNELKDHIKYAKPVEGYRFRTNIDSESLYNGVYYLTTIDVPSTKKIVEVKLVLNTEITGNIGIHVKGITFEVDNLEKDMTTLRDAVASAVLSNDPRLKQQDNVTQTGEFANAEGQGGSAIGLASHTEGLNCTSEGLHAHSEGEGSSAPGNNAHAEGLQSSASGQMSHAQNGCTNAMGNYSHAGGLNSQANGEVSFTHGNGTIAQGQNQTVFGKFNELQGEEVITNTDFAIIVGNGTDDSNRSNAMALDWDGNLFVSGAVIANGVELGSGSGSDVVNQINGMGGYLEIAAGNGITVTNENGLITLEATGGGGGGTGKIYANKVVGTSTLSYTSSNVDHLCNGTNDESVINQAISEVMTYGGGKVVLLEGTYVISSPIILASNIILEGQGINTIIQIAPNRPSAMVAMSGADVNNVTIMNLKVDGNTANQTVAPGTSWGGIKFTGNSSDNTVINCDATGSRGSGFVVSGATVIRTTFDNCRSYSNNSSGFVSSNGTKLKLVKCTSRLNGTGLTLTSADGTIVADCQVSENTGSGIVMNNTKNLLVSTCVVNNNTSYGISGYPTDSLVIGCILFENGDATHAQINLTNPGTAGNSTIANCVVRKGNNVTVAYGVSLAAGTTGYAIMNCDLLNSGNTAPVQDNGSGNLISNYR